MSFILIESIFKFFKNINPQENTSSLYDDNFLCFCRQSIPLQESEIRRHIQTCKLYQKESPFYRDFLQLPLNTFKQVHLLALKCEFYNFIDLLNEQLNKLNAPRSGENSSRQDSDIVSSLSSIRSSPQVISPFSSQVAKSAPLSKFSSNQLKRFQSPVLQSQQHSTEYCQGCGIKSESFLKTTRMIYVGTCYHPFCSICVSKQIRSDYLRLEGILQCKKCSSRFKDEDIKEALGVDKFQELVKQLVEVRFQLIQCSKCNLMVRFKLGKESSLIHPVTKRPLSKEHLKHYNENRLVCPQCNQEQCLTCKQIPYHIGTTCIENELQVDKKCCQYCNVANEGGRCANKDCQTKEKYACKKRLNCGHHCCGFVDETKCPPCLKCSDQYNYNDYCSICFVETLGQAPCIISKCGHIFHYTCILKTLQLQYPGPDITFNFCLCSLCKRWLNFDSASEPQFILEQQKLLRDKIKGKALEHWKQEQTYKKKETQQIQTQQQSKQQGEVAADESEQAIAEYCYYMCCRCKQPYFGGVKECQQLADFNSLRPEDLICPECAQSESCAKHGREFIIHKCRFCCSRAIYFCWGTTHFCDICHLKQSNGDYLNRKTRDKLPKCQGLSQCPSGGKHRPNGEEQALGCLLCMNQEKG